MDKEKVLSALHCRAQDLMIDLPSCDGCDYQIQMVHRMGCDYRRICKDAIELLKAQEAKTVESIQMDRNDKWGADLTGYCPSCKRPLKSRFNQRFCGECGQAVKWE